MATFEAARWHTAIDLYHANHQSHVRSDNRCCYDSLGFGCGQPTTVPSTAPNVERRWPFDDSQPAGQNLCHWHCQIPLGSKLATVAIAIAKTLDCAQNLSLHVGIGPTSACAYSSRVSLHARQFNPTKSDPTAVTRRMQILLEDRFFLAPPANLTDRGWHANLVGFAPRFWFRKTGAVPIFPPSAARETNMSLRQQQQQPKQRVVADGWGRQASGSVFCAESSLRFIYESQPDPPVPGTAAAAISSLASGEFAKNGTSVLPQQPYKPHDHTRNHNHSMGMGMYAAALSSPYDKLTSGGDHQSLYGHQQSMMMMNKMNANGHNTTNNGRGADGVDLFEAEIARACAQITRQAPSLPHSFRECSVCLTQNAYAQISVCGHTFHSKCFLRWFRVNRSCPLCRGPVDKIQCAPVVSVQDELEAIMAEMDDHESSAALTVVDPLMENPDLISFLGEGFEDADMDMMPLEDMPTVAESAHLSHQYPSQHQPQDDEEEHHDDENMEMEDEDEDDATQPMHLHQAAPSLQPVMQMQMPMPMQMQMPVQMQFAPTSTMPNYWNVLNQGLSMPSVMPAPILPAPPQTQMQQLQAQQLQSAAQPQQPPRMVHIAPKPDGPFPPPHNHGHHSHNHSHAAHQHPFATGAAGGVVRAASPSLAAAAAASLSPTAPRVVSCRCTGGCRNGRCACVKEGGMCGVSCRCTSCKNPFLMVKAAGADIDALLQDACFMHNVSKTRDMVVRMQEPVEVPCCGRTIKVIDCVQGYTCTACDNGRVFDFSWCMNKLLDHDKTPRNHCEICKRCCDHRDVHCDDCGRCYFAGVAASLPCPCKESSRKRRDPHHQQHSQNQNQQQHAGDVKQETGDQSGDADEKDGECTIM